MLSSVPPRKAGAASAISETSYEMGAVLGTVIIGGMLTAVYRANVVVPSGLDESLTKHAHETLGGAVTVASHVGGEQSSQLLSSAFAAFDSGTPACGFPDQAQPVTGAGGTVEPRRYCTRGNARAVLARHHERPTPGTRVQ